jgi:hypothetical protein
MGYRWLAELQTQTKISKKKKMESYGGNDHTNWIVLPCLENVRVLTEGRIIWKCD